MYEGLRQEYIDCCWKYVTEGSCDTFIEVQELARRIIADQFNAGELIDIHASIYQQFLKCSTTLPADCAQRLLAVSIEVMVLCRNALQQRLPIKAEHDLLETYVEDVEYLLAKLAETNELLDEKVFELSGHEKQLIKLRQVSQAVLQNANFGVIVVDENQEITMINKKASEIWCVTGNVTGKNVREVFNQLPQETKTFLFNALSGRKIDSERANLVINGEHRILQVTSDSIYNRNGRKEGTVAIFYDDTDKEKEQAVLKENIKLATMGQMAAGVAHELKNPLTVIKGFSQLVITKKPDYPKLDIYLKRILDEAERANGFINDFLNIAKPKEPKMRQVQVNAIISETLELVESHCFLKGIRVIRELDPELPYIMGDPNQLKQVLLNVVKNSLEAMEEEVVKDLTIRTASASTSVNIYVIDTGPGIPEDILKKIGRPFFSTKKYGTGLGLSISRQIIAHHRGELILESQSDGTRVTITLPVRQQLPELS